MTSLSRRTSSAPVPRRRRKRCKLTCAHVTQRGACTGSGPPPLRISAPLEPLDQRRHHGTPLDRAIYARTPRGRLELGGRFRFRVGLGTLEPLNTLKPARNAARPRRRRASALRNGLWGPPRADPRSTAAHLTAREHKPRVLMIALADEELVRLCRDPRYAERPRDRRGSSQDELETSA